MKAHNDIIGIRQELIFFKSKNKSSTTAEKINCEILKKGNGTGMKINKYCYSNKQ